MAAGDQAFNTNDFVNAMSGYQKALSIKPNDQTAKNKYASADAKLAQQNRLKPVIQCCNYRSQQTIDLTNVIRKPKKNTRRLCNMPRNRIIPKRQISKIDELLAQQEAEIKLRKDFDQAVAEAESLLKKQGTDQGQRHFYEGL